MKKLLMMVAVIVLAACSAAAGGAKGSGSDRGVLTREEILKSGIVDAFTAVQTLRPQWLVKRGTTSLNQAESIKVYLDGNLMGAPEQLRQISSNSIENIRYMDGLEATQRYGLDHGQGAVLVFTKRGK